MANTKDKNQVTTKAFQEIVWEFYRTHGRHSMAWRQSNKKNGELDPYKIMVSEVMLQQTQVARVTIKYHEFLETFPDIRKLAKSEFGDVLRAWQGLGYNRRAQYLWRAAQIVELHYGGNFPETIDKLVELPGIGNNTAAAIMVYSWNIPEVFIETNIRTVFIHHFFNDHSNISDKELIPLVKNTLPTDISKTREWYWALMDYGSYIKQTVGNLNKLSKSYTKQDTFVGSKRQVRGVVIRLLATAPQTLSMLTNNIDDDRLPSVLEELVAETMIQRHGSHYSL